MKTNINTIKWQDPFEKIWGFHIHQEVPLQDFDRALVIQEQCFQFLHARGIHINDTDCMKPGYGPHLNYIWDLRVEHDTNPLEKMGQAISWLSLNRFGLSAYIHPLMTDKTLLPVMSLNAEGRENQTNILWFSHQVEHYQEFFFNPPIDNENNVVDTRTPRIMSREEKEILYQSGKQKLAECKFLNPEDTIVNGFHIHMDYALHEEELAMTIFDRFIVYLIEIGMRPTRTRLYEPFKNGPHLLHGWEIKFEACSRDILKKIGIAIGWLMCNRQGMPVFVHPVTWAEGDRNSELQSHEQYAMFIGSIPPLDLNFFKKVI